MTELPPAADQPSLEGLFRTLRDTEWSWDRAGFPALAERFGWTVTYQDDNGVIADVPWPAPRRPVQLAWSRGAVDEVSITLASVAGLPEAPPDFLPGVFDLAVRTGTAILGEPGDGRPADHPQVRWPGERATIVLDQLPVAVLLTWADNEWLAIADWSDEDDG
ncbi:hypothetical protein ACWT_1466 [Actinoplanes sp. SE50]|uniref:DUF6301 family protein n=1 Tax=unclassified Actinoplanes TaxID=2626549 RepID=UPI00023EC3FB|nr:MULTISPECIES: DUF6301 family protein [unclassified Actinoplanes]AEV82484.1 hypothetical protein ACPL_1587 [Actinoplanes sp. SE50/110]ATO80881.1 hypothetical protein ACWT_1466 [Actinoplanes sp. SE50]SLL98288.1 hypothetical protein ACSP50_1514 [Actinoplanes sp. SE50/110]